MESSSETGPGHAGFRARTGAFFRVGIGEDLRVCFKKREGSCMFRNIYGLDLGTYEIKVFDKKRDYIWKEKNVIAKKDKEFLYAAGDEAWVMFEKAPEDIEVLFPMQGGAIARFNDMQCLLEALLKKERLFYRGAEYLVAVPTDVTEVEKRAFYDLVYHSAARAKTVRIAERGIVDAVGAGVNVKRTDGIFVVNMGGGSTEISILSHGGMVMNRLMKLGGEHLDQAIQNHVRHHMEFLIGRRTAEMLRQDFGIFEDATCTTISVSGRNLRTRIPEHRDIPVSMVRAAMKDPLKECVSEITAMFERTPPTVRSGIEKNGICLTGGLANLKELPTYLEESTGLTVKTTSRPELCVVEGLKKIIQDKRAYRELTYSLLDGEYKWFR